MKVLPLDDCEYLTHIPNVSNLPNLEKLSFKNCMNLIKIHNSIRHLNKLESLCSKGCRKFKSFPSLGLASLNNLGTLLLRDSQEFSKIIMQDDKYQSD